MAKLVECLVSGIAGAESGTATFVLRGTASSAASVLYTDFEMTAQPGTNIITLDSNGSAEIYVNAYCDMTLKTEAGATIRTVTVGDSATTVEVISDSFTGTDYSGSPSAVSEPITLAAVLDKWNDSAGQPDWQVDVGGVATDLSSAFASLAGIYFNVKDPAYGAVGDGVTDDTTAIANAIAASNGSIVFFPPGTYKISTLTITDSNYNLLGSGPGSSIISGYQASTNLLLLDNSVEGFGTICQLGFAATAAYTNGIAVSPTQNVQITNCHLDTTNFDNGICNLDFAGGSFILINGSIFTVDALSDSAIANLADDQECSIAVNGCLFEVDSGFTGSIILGPDFNVNNCIFDASAVTSGAYYHVNSQSNETAGVFFGTFTSNKFFDGGSSGFAFNLDDLSSGSIFKEDVNDFYGFTAPTSFSDTGHIYDNSANDIALLECDVYLGSRKGRTVRIEEATAAASVTKACLYADVIFVTFTNDATFTLDIDTAVLPPGAQVFFFVKNGSAGVNDVSFSAGSTTATVSSVAVGGIATATAIMTMRAAGQDEICIMSTSET